MARPEKEDVESWYLGDLRLLDEAVRGRGEENLLPDGVYELTWTGTAMVGRRTYLYASLFKQSCSLISSNACFLNEALITCKRS